MSKLLVRYCGKQMRIIGIINEELNRDQLYRLKILDMDRTDRYIDIIEYEVIDVDITSFEKVEKELICDSKVDPLKMYKLRKKLENLRKISIETQAKDIQRGVYYTSRYNAKISKLECKVSEACDYIYANLGYDGYLKKIQLVIDDKRQRIVKFNRDVGSLAEGPMNKLRGEINDLEEEIEIVKKHEKLCADSSDDD